ncbi:VCBS domain-containing protein, partial [Aphanothece microscopica]|uniref:VCBS domain-containing protein n=1 Tax=Aphanothece microscopica TaxID=1049561 RepID=UPI003984B30A
AAGTASGGDAEGDSISGFEHVMGHVGADRLTGDAGDNLLMGFGGDDTLAGGGGSDTLMGGAGNDEVRLTGQRAGYDIVSQGRTTTIVDIDSSDGDDGVIRAMDVEFLAFADGSRLQLGATVLPPRGNSTSGVVTEDSTDVVTGSLPPAAPGEGGAGYQMPASLVGLYGTFTFDPLTGAWSYTLDNARAETQALAGGAVVLDSLTVLSADGTASQAINVTVRGANDAATITAPPQAVLREGSMLTISGDMGVEDRDSGEAMFRAPETLDGIYGTFTFDVVTGVWTYALDNDRPATRALSNGRSVTDSLEVLSLDGTDAKVIAISILGSGGTAAISGTVLGALREDDAAPVGGDLDIAAGDTGESSFAAPASLAGTYGDFAFDAATGAWSYALDNTRSATQALADGETVTERLLVSTAFGSASSTITVTVTGTNDAAVITGDVSGSIAEGSAAVVSGDLDIA